MTKAEAYLDRLYNEWRFWQEKLEELPKDCDIAANEVYSRYSRRAKITSARYYAAKYMMHLMKEDIEND